MLIDRFSPALATYFAAVLVVFTGFGVFFAPLPAYLAGVGFGSSETFALYFALNAAAAAFYGRAGRLAEAYGVYEVHAGALLGRGVALPTVAVVGVAGGSTLFALSATGAAFVAIGVTWAAIAVTAAALVTRLAPPAIRGEALGAYGALVAVGGGFGGIVGGWLASSGYPIAFVAAGGTVVVGTGIVVALARRPGQRSERRHGTGEETGQ